MYLELQRQTVQSSPGDHSIWLVRRYKSRQAKPSAWSAMPSQPGSQLSAATRAARASSTVLLRLDRWAAMTWRRRERSSAASSDAEAALLRWPKRLATRFFSHGG